MSICRGPARGHPCLRCFSDTCSSLTAAAGRGGGGWGGGGGGGGREVRHRYAAARLLLRGRAAGCAPVAPAPRACSPHAAGPGLTGCWRASGLWSCPAGLLRGGPGFGSRLTSSRSYGDVHALCAFGRTRWTALRNLAGGRIDPEYRGRRSATMPRYAAACRRQRPDWFVLELSGSKVDGQAHNRSFLHAAARASRQAAVDLSRWSGRRALHRGPVHDTRWPAGAAGPASHAGQGSARAVPRRRLSSWRRSFCARR